MPGLFFNIALTEKELSIKTTNDLTEWSANQFGRGGNPLPISSLQWQPAIYLFNAIYLLFLPQNKENIENKKNDFTTWSLTIGFSFSFETSLLPKRIPCTFLTVSEVTPFPTGQRPSAEKRLGKKRKRWSPLDRWTETGMFIIVYFHVNVQEYKSSRKQ